MAVTEPPSPRAHEAVPLAAQVAAVDLGSNSFHLIVARVVDGRLHVLDRLREMVRLGGGVNVRGELDPAVAERALECLRRFGQRLRGLPAGNVRAVGTNALRQARAGDFLARAQQALGHGIEIVSGREEARLIFLGVARGEPAVEGRRLVVDIGGGSTELIIGQGVHPLHTESLEIGCVSASELVGETITDKSMRRAELAARLELEPFEEIYRRAGWAQALGSSGTIKAVGAVVRAQAWTDEAGIGPADLARLYDALLQAGSPQALKLPELASERRAVFAGGVAVLRAVFDALGVERMQVAESALREGLLYDLLGRMGREDVRGGTIDALCERFAVDRAQGARVEQSARELLAQVQTGWDLDGEEYAALLGWAGRLHELGLALSHSRYHRHGAYVLEHADLPGFSRDEQRRLALLVLAHRRKFPLDAFEKLSSAERRPLTRLAILLRLAVLLHRGRHAAAPPTPRMTGRTKRITLEFPSGWLAQHPLTDADIAAEAQYLQSLGLALTWR